MFNLFELFIALIIADTPPSKKRSFKQLYAKSEERHKKHLDFIYSEAYTALEECREKMRKELVPQLEGLGCTLWTAHRILRKTGLSRRKIKKIIKPAPGEMRIDGRPYFIIIDDDYRRRH